MGQLPSVDGAGTPPRARGRPERLAQQMLRMGNTPACAGTTPHRQDPPGPLMGTPPRARGRLVLDVPTPRTAGNTPACAGTTRSPRVRSPWTREHPRVRGDDLVSVVEPLVEEGTPPRARGRLSVGRRARSRRGNTPACAGTTGRGAPLRGGGGEHPRVRGDDDLSSSDYGEESGTPPRARGRQFVTCGFMWLRGCFCLLLEKRTYLSRVATSPYPRLGMPGVILPANHPRGRPLPQGRPCGICPGNCEGERLPRQCPDTCPRSLLARTDLAGFSLRRF